MQDAVGYTTVGGDLEGSLSVIENDPVCDAAVDVEAARESGLVAEFADRIYVFCGTACRDRFLAEPVLYSVAGRPNCIPPSPTWTAKSAGARSPAGRRLTPQGRHRHPTITEAAPSATGQLLIPAAAGQRPGVRPSSPRPRPGTHRTPRPLPEPHRSRRVACVARPPFDRLQQLLEDWLAELPLGYTHSAD